MNHETKAKNHITRISPKNSWLNFRLAEVWQYRDLIILFTKRGFQLSYKQTVLGPLWLILRPFFTSVVYAVVFGRIAGIRTPGVPALLFYLAGTAVWGFFSYGVTSNAFVFNANASLFGKVYFPRLTVPISQILSALIHFLIQMSMVMLLLIYYCAAKQLQPVFRAWILIPLILLELGTMAMGLGIIISSLTTKYRDLSVLVGFGMNLWMFCTPIVYPYSQVPEGWIRTAVKLNPVTPMVELFRYALLGAGDPMLLPCLYSVIFTIVVAFLGVLIFSRVERTFMDTV